MICKYCNKEMKETNMFDNDQVKTFNCTCGALYISDLEEGKKMWHDGKPPRAHCIESFDVFKKGEDYRIVNADICQILIRLNDGEYWIDKDDTRFELYV